MQENITQEQAFYLRRVELEAQEMSKEELIGALLDCWEARFQQKQIFQASSRAAGLMFRLDEEEPCYVLESEEDLQKIFGHEPTEEEIDNYLRRVWEHATMELDMEEIILDSED